MARVYFCVYVSAGDIGTYSRCTYFYIRVLKTAQRRARCIQMYGVTFLARLWLIAMIGVDFFLYDKKQKWLFHVCA